MKDQETKGRMACHHRHTAPHASAPPHVKTDARLVLYCVSMRVSTQPMTR